MAMQLFTYDEMIKILEEQKNSTIKFADTKKRYYVGYDCNTKQVKLRYINADSYRNWEDFSDGVKDFMLKSKFKIVYNYGYSESKELVPIGVIPKNMWKEQRRDELAAAIIRYSQTGNLIPMEWVKEYNEFVMEK